VIFLIALGLLSKRPGEAAGDSVRAVQLMSRSIQTIRAGRAEAGVPIDAGTDLNRTGLIGLENSSITTSLGRLEAKRTATNPQFAGAVVRMLREAGVRSGDTIAVGASSSFPGLFVASLCAARAMNVRALAILSLGASNWGGNDPRWTGLETLTCLTRNGVLDAALIAVSIGGDGDAGRDMSAEGRAFLRRKIDSSGIPWIGEAILADDVRARWTLFASRARPAAIRAFINIGGSWANMGLDAEVLKLKPGFNPAAGVFVPPPGRRGLIQEMAVRGIPVIHLLYVQGLAERYGLPWDPYPFPALEEGRPKEAAFPAAAIYLFGMMIGVGVFLGRRRRSWPGF
jgi:poly-gamma-glutamate system protein